MEPKIRTLALVAATLGFAACGGGGAGSAGSAGTAGSIDGFNITGIWEAEFPVKTDSSGTHNGKGKVTFGGNTYTYSWYKKLTGPNNTVVYDWTETARETGSVSATSDYMEWTAESFGEAEYNQANNTWGSIDMKSSKNDYAIQYTLDGNKLTLKEDINLDGDFADEFEAPETLTYTKAN